MVAPNAVRTTDKIKQPEMLIGEYNLMNWKNSNYIGKDASQACMPANVPERLRGIVRRSIATASIAATSETAAPEAIEAAANVLSAVAGAGA
jgi:hypothetical protein